MNPQEASILLTNHPILTLLSLLLTILVAKSCFSPKPTKTPPPSPPKLPILGHLPLLGLFPHRSLHAMSRRRGPLMLLHLGSSPTLVASSAAAAREIMKTRPLVAFGRKYGESEFKEVLGEFIKILGVFDVGDFVPWLAWVRRVNGLHRRVERVFGRLDAFLGRVIDDHVARKRPEGVEKEMDFVDVLLKVQEDRSLGFSLTVEHIKAIILDVFAAGTDTTFTALEWAMTEMLKHPHVLHKAQKEIRTIVGANQTITEADIDKMLYLKAVIKESLRMHPPIPLLVPRESSKDVTINGYHIAAGTRVIINAWSIGRDPETWDDPDEFRPERFTGRVIDFKGQDFELIPFGAGRRGCPGIVFAATTIEFVLASLLHRLDWELPGGDLDMSESAGMSIKRKTPLIAVPILRPV